PLPAVRLEASLTADIVSVGARKRVGIKRSRHRPRRSEPRQGQQARNFAFRITREGTAIVGSVRVFNPDGTKHALRRAAVNFLIVYITFQSSRASPHCGHL